jgi:late competence protein required for DNA uptake (superfamily II DNA/RNA helicase)
MANADVEKIAAIKQPRTRDLAFIYEYDTSTGDFLEDIQPPCRTEIRVEARPHPAPAHEPSFNWIDSSITRCLLWARSRLAPVQKPQFVLSASALILATYYVVNVI